MKTELPSAIHLFSSLILNTIFYLSLFRFYYTNLLANSADPIFFTVSLALYFYRQY